MLATASSAEIAAQSCQEVKLKVAHSRDEREASFRLIYNAYLRAGLCEPNEKGLRFTPYQMLPSTDILIAKLREEVICTLSLARDGKLGLPMEELYSEAIASRRAAGLQLAEVTCLADRRSDARRFFAIFCDLSRVMVQLAVKAGIDQVLIAVHPRHAAMYRRYMGFQQVGEQRDWSKVQGKPAVPLCLDLKNIGVKRPPCWNRFFEEQLPDSVLQHRPIAAADQQYFQSILMANGTAPSEFDPTNPYGFVQNQDSQWQTTSANVLVCA